MKIILLIIFSALCGYISFFSSRNYGLTFKDKNFWILYGALFVAYFCGYERGMTE